LSFALFALSFILLLSFILFVFVALFYFTWLAPFLCLLILKLCLFVFVLLVLSISISISISISLFSIQAPILQSTYYSITFFFCSLYFFYTATFSVAFLLMFMCTLALPNFWLLYYLLRYTLFATLYSICYVATWLMGSNFALLRFHILHYFLFFGLAPLLV
jgi:hypothetical protein